MLIFSITVSVFLLLQFDLIRGVRNDILNVGGASISLIQIVRDSALVQSILLLFHIISVIGGRASKRFLMLTAPVTKIIVPFTLEDKAISKASHVLDGNESQVEIASGFLTRQQTTRNVYVEPNGDVGKAPNGALKVYVDRLVMRQSSSIVCYLFGMHQGHGLFHLMDTSKIVGFLLIISHCIGSILLVLTCTPAFGTIPSAWAFLCIPTTLFIFVRGMLLKSGKVISLLARRIGFWIEILFLVIWFVTTCLTLGDARSCIVIQICGATLVERILKDADLTIVNVDIISVLIRSLQSFVIGSQILVLSAFILFDQVPLLNHPLLDFRLDTIGEGLRNQSNPNDASVWDFSQTSCDVGSTFALFHLLIGARVVRRAYRKGFSFVAEASPHPLHLFT